MKENLHQLLLRQLKKAGLTPDAVPQSDTDWRTFLARVNQAYSEADEERYTLERSLRLSSEEMIELYEQARAASSHLLQKERDKLTVIVSSIAQGVVVLNEQYHIELLNPAAEKLLEVSAERISGLKFDRAFGVAGWDVELTKVLHTREAATIETRFARRNGAIFPAEVRIVPIQTADGKYLGSVLTVDDITRQKEAEGVLHSARDAALVASQHKSNYLAEMSHEIRTPLNSILSLVQLLSYTQLEEEQRADLDTLESCVHALRQIINDVLDLSKIEAGKLALHPQHFSLQTSLQTVVAQFRGSFQEKRLVVDVKCEEAIPERVVGDAVRVEQVLINLVSNAIKFTPEGGRIDVHLTRVQQNSTEVEIRFDIRDSGPGISPEKQAKIFCAFDQGDEATFSNHGGTGLGLYICSRLTSLMKGRISLVSEPGKGTCFTVHIPFALKPLKEHETPTGDDITVTPDVVARPNVRILLVEDNEINQNTIGRILEHRGYTVSLAENGQAALSRMNDQEFDVVLMDLHMPHMGGLEAARHIRSGSAPWSKVPIVAITAHAIQGVAESCYEAGMDAFITKPINYAQLFSVVEKLAAPLTLRDGE